MAANAAAQEQDAEREKINALIATLAELEEPAESIEQLAKLGETAIPSLSSALESEDARVRERAAKALGGMRAAAVPALPRLIEALEREPSSANLAAIGSVAVYADPELVEASRTTMFEHVLTGSRRTGWFSFDQVGRALHRFDMGTAHDQKALLEKLESKQAFEREFAAELLATRGDEDALPALRKAILSDHPKSLNVNWRWNGVGGSFSTTIRADATVRTAASRAYLAIAGHGPDSGPAQACLLHHGTPSERRRAARMIGQCEWRDKEMLSALEHGLISKDLTVLRESITSLGMLGTFAKPMIPSIETFLEHEDKQVIARAKAALRMIRE